MAYGTKYNCCDFARANSIHTATVIYMFYMTVGRIEAWTLNIA